MHELMFQAVSRCESLKGMSERSELIPCIYYNFLGADKTLMNKIATTRWINMSHRQVEIYMSKFCMIM